MGEQEILSLPSTSADIHADATPGPLEWWRHGVGQGGINPAPLPPGVQEGVRRLQPRLVRVFLQEFFQVYTNEGRYDWSRLDPYLASFARTGARIVAAICIKPRRLYPRVDQRVWRPTNVGEWQAVIAELVHRYSVRRRLVTHWEILNEPDIGEEGGTPHLIPDPESYYAFYRFTVEPILKVFPGAKVGGPATTWAGGEPLPGFVERCARDGMRLDFVSWHRYEDDPGVHAAGVEQVKKRLAAFRPNRPETMVTEWNKAFDPVSVEELAFDPSRAAAVASTLLSFLDSGLDWSFYYHLWDQSVRAADFAPFLSRAGVRNMVHHWNEVPHRFGLFGVSGEVRPQYFVYWMFSQMGEARLQAETGHSGLRILAARSAAGAVNGLLINARKDTGDRLVNVRFHKLEPGRKQLAVYRIDSRRKWDASSLQLLPVERREVDTGMEFSCQVISPAPSVTLLRLRDIR